MKCNREDFQPGTVVKATQEAIKCAILNEHKEYTILEIVNSGNLSGFSCKLDTSPSQYDPAWLEVNPNVKLFKQLLGINES